MNYADDYLKLKEHLRDMGDAMLHKRYEDVPTLIKAMRMRLVRVETWLKEETGFTWAELRNLGVQSAESSETK